MSTTAQLNRTATAVLSNVRFVLDNFQTPVLATFTFADNVTDKADAQRRWDKLSRRLLRRYPGICAVGVWQRQQRGAWHLHLVVSCRLEINWLREAALASGFGTFVDLQYINRRGFRGKTTAQVARYITRYFVRDQENGEGRIVQYLGPARKWTTRFRFVSGIHKLWRMGRSVLEAEYPDERPPTCDMRKVLLIGFWAMGRDEREELLRKSDAVCRLVYPERYPF